MSIAEPTRQLMTIEEFLALPEDPDRHYELIDGELREYDMTTRSPIHSVCISRTVAQLQNWLDQHRDLRGVIAAGDARCRLTPDEPNMVGIDVAYFAGADAWRQCLESRYFEGPPVLAVEVHSPSDVMENIWEKVQKYLSSGTRMVWLVDPILQMISVMRPGQPPVAYNNTQQISDLADLPGLEFSVAKLFLPA